MREGGHHLRGYLLQQHFSADSRAQWTFKAIVARLRELSVSRGNYNLDRNSVSFESTFLGECFTLRDCHRDNLINISASDYLQLNAFREELTTLIESEAKATKPRKKRSRNDTTSSDVEPAAKRQV
jgi:hypothetical protein